MKEPLTTQWIKRGYQLKQQVLSEHKREGGGDESLPDHRNECLTNITRSTAGCGHNTARSLNLWQSEVTDHNLGVFVHAVIQQILWLQKTGQMIKEEGFATDESTASQIELLHFCLPWTIPSSLCGRSPYHGDIWLHPRSGGWAGWHLSPCRSLSPRSCQTARLQIPWWLNIKEKQYWQWVLAMTFCDQHFYSFFSPMLFCKCPEHTTKKRNVRERINTRVNQKLKRCIKINISVQGIYHLCIDLFKKSQCFGYKDFS